MKPNAFFALVKEQVALPPAVTAGPQLVGPIGVKSGGTDSLTVKVPGASPVKVTLPVPPMVEMVAAAVTLPGPRVSVNVKLPLPPVVFFVTLSEPRALLVKAQVKVAPGPTTALQLVDPTGTKSGLGLSVTV